jgi:hypothetical protein
MTDTYDSMRLDQLKDECRRQGKKVGGKKCELIERLRGNEPLFIKTKVDAESRVNGLLKKAGLLDFDSTSKCARKAILKKHIIFTGTAAELDSQAVVKIGGKVRLLEVPCVGCEQILKPTLRNLLEQPDASGLDYEEGGQFASIQHNEDPTNPNASNSDCPGTYLISMCDGDFSSNNGKFSQHCVYCPKNFGKHLGDYRMSHCENCGRHFFEGLSGFKCDHCGGGEDDDEFDEEEYYY